MKKLLFLALFATLAFAVKAKTPVQVFNNNPCGAPMTITFYASQHGPCNVVAVSTTFTIPPLGNITVDMDDPTIWPMPLPSYLCFGARVCIDCTPFGGGLHCSGLFGEPCCYPASASISGISCCPLGTIITCQWTVGGSGGVAHTVNVF